MCVVQSVLFSEVDLFTKIRFESILQLKLITMLFYKDMVRSVEAETHSVNFRCQALTGRVAKLSSVCAHLW